MKEIVCPKCKEPIMLNEADYESIVSQVRNAEFEQQLNVRIHEIEIVAKVSE